MARRFLTLVRLAVVPILALTGLALLASPASAATNTTTTVTRSAAVSGSPVTFTATVVHASGVPTGTVTFTVTGASSTSYTCDGGNVANLSPNMSGPGSVATCKFAAGLEASDSPYAITAVYSGDSNFNTSTGMLSTHHQKGLHHHHRVLGELSERDGTAGELHGNDFSGEPGHGNPDGLSDVLHQRNRRRLGGLRHHR